MHILKAGILYFAVVFGVGFPAWTHPHTLGSPAAWRENGRTLGNACHDRGHNCGSAVDRSQAGCAALTSEPTGYGLDRAYSSADR